MCTYLCTPTVHTYLCNPNPNPNPHSFRTEEFASRCLPTSSSFAGGSSDLCASPPCTDAALNASLGGGVTCAALVARFYP